MKYIAKKGCNAGDGKIKEGQIVELDQKDPVVKKLAQAGVLLPAPDEKEGK